MISRESLFWAIVKDVISTSSDSISTRADVKRITRKAIHLILIIMLGCFSSWIWNIAQFQSDRVCDYIRMFIIWAQNLDKKKKKKDGCVAFISDIRGENI